MVHKLKFILCFLALFYQTGLYALEKTEGIERKIYTINSGDILDISVWNEDVLKRVIRVLPDGYISFPLVGEIAVSGASLPQIKQQLTEKLARFIADPVVNISVQSAEGNIVYVIGQVKRPGQFVMYQPLDVMQVLSLAGGLTAFAQANDIVILRRTDNGKVAIEFEYGALEEGDELDSNILLKSGDVIVVP